MKDNIIIINYSGFFLIELLFAICIFSLTSLIILQSHSGLIEKKRNIILFNNAILIAESIISEESLLMVNNSYTKKIKEYFIKIDNIPLKNLPKNFILKQLTISWSLSNIKKELLFYYGKSIKQA